MPSNSRETRELEDLAAKRARMDKTKMKPSAKKEAHMIVRKKGRKGEKPTRRKMKNALLTSTRLLHLRQVSLLTKSLLSFRLEIITNISSTL